MDKGTRVEIIKGYKGVGVTGTVFWSGPDKYNDGETRIGVKGEDGETYWVNSKDVQETDEEAAEVASPPIQNSEPAGDGPPLSRGSRVEWGDGMAGTIFWYGASKFGDGMRAGVEADDGTKHWIDAFELTAVADTSSSSRADEVPPPSDDDPISSSSAPPWAYDDSDPGPVDGGYIPMSDEPVYIDDSDMPPPDDLF